MIPRYSRDIVTNIWSQESKYKIWLDIEIYAAEAMEKYKAKYGLNSAHLTLEKDLSDAVAAHKMDVVREKLIPLLKQYLVNELAL